MSDQPASRSFSARLPGWFTLRRAAVYTGIFVYCLVLFLAFDFAYSSSDTGRGNCTGLRIANPVYDHGFVGEF